MQLLRELARSGVTGATRRTIPVAAPAVATGITVTPESGRVWEVMSLATSLVADANVANRAVSLALTDGASTLWTLPPAVVQVAAATVGYSWIADYPTPAVTIVGGQQAMPLPPVILLPGWTLTLAIGAVQVGDQLGASKVQVIERFFGNTEAEYDLARIIERRADALALALSDEVLGA